MRHKLFTAYFDYVPSDIKLSQSSGRIDLEFVKECTYIEIGLKLVHIDSPELPGASQTFLSHTFAE